MQKNKVFKFCLLLMLYAHVAQAQEQPKLCGKYTIDTNLFKKMLQIEATHRPTATTIYIVRVFFHICRYNDGTHAAATAANIQTEFSTLLADYKAGNTCFINEGTDYIDNTSLDTANADKSGTPQLFVPYILPECVNIFYTEKIGGINQACAGGCGYGGITFGIPNSYCLVAKGNVGAGHTISHEVGHCLGLLHSFDYSNGYEDVNEANAATAGDLITDTKADPYAYIGQGCFTTGANGCTYTGNCRGDSTFTPPYTNMMAYWWNGTAGSCYSSLALTTGQFTRTGTFLTNFQPLVDARLYNSQDLVNWGSPLNNDLGANLQISSGGFRYSATNQVMISGSNNLISGSAIVNLVGGTNVLLEPGLIISPSSGKVIATVAATCSN